MAEPIVLAQHHFEKVQEAMEEALRDANRRAAEVLLAAMEKAISLQDHSLEELRQMGHPYRRNAPRNQPHPDYLVHSQEGDLFFGLEIEHGQTGGVIISDGIVSHAEHTLHVLLGTRYMRPRDFVTYALDQTQDEVDHLYRDAIQKTLAQFSG